MARQKSYYEMLRDPRWQRKRLEIMQRANFTCEACGNTEETLNIHHGYYEKDKAPWEYPNRSLHCLCESCHLDVQQTLGSMQQILGQFNVAQVSRALGYLMAMSLDESDKAREMPIYTRQQAQGVMDFFRVTYEKAMDYSEAWDRTNNRQDTAY